MIFAILFAIFAHWIRHHFSFPGLFSGDIAVNPRHSAELGLSHRQLEPGGRNSVRALEIL